MRAEPTFFRKISTRLVGSRQEIDVEATRLYNKMVEPKDALRPRDAYWTDPFNFKRANLTGFKSYEAFAEDANALIVKPYIYSALAAYELQKMMLCFPAALGQMVKLSPSGFVNKIVDFFHALISAVLLSTMSDIELYLQAGSLAIRLGRTAFDFFAGGSKAVGANKLPSLPEVPAAAAACDYSSGQMT